MALFAYELARHFVLENEFRSRRDSAITSLLGTCTSAKRPTRITAFIAAGRVANQSDCYADSDRGDACASARDISTRR